jgi:histidyl-tRNA synthetase
MKYQAPPGVFDIIPEDSREPWRSTHLWQYVEEVIHRTAKEYGFQEIRTPIFERSELFHRCVGESSDIVSKEMYLFQDKGDRQMALRPEGTAPALRAFLEQAMPSRGQVHKLYYVAPMFRYDRPQAGRYRQHHQFGAEAIGIPSAEQDVEVIDILYTVYRRLGLKDLTVKINSIGGGETRERYRNALKDYFQPHFHDLSSDSQRRLESNPLRILDSKDPKDQELAQKAPRILDYLDEASRAHFEEVQRLLESLKIPYTLDPLLVRGLDYYNSTVFEITANALGAQNSIGGGGRYDGLIKMLGGPDLPACGFGSGIERILQTMLGQELAPPLPPGPMVYLIPLGEQAQKEGFLLLHELREMGIPSAMELGGRKLGKAMHYADQLRARYVVVIGDDEIQQGEVNLKLMENGEEMRVPISSLAKILRIEMQAAPYINILHEMSQPFGHKAEMQFFLRRIKSSVDNTKEMIDKYQNSFEHLIHMLEDHTKE